MIGLQTKLMIGGIVALVVGLSIYFGYRYVVNLQEKVEFQAGEITKLETANQTLTAERKQLETDLEENKKNQEVLHEELRAAREDKNELVKLFSDHNFTKLVNKKPGLLENRINKGTDKVFKELEDISNE